ncbi:MAG: precorrin-3B C(17)-methyltransferase, partial [Pseudomonadota bacterium]
MAEARRILLQYRTADTPVLVAATLGRPAERLLNRTLGALSPDEVDMLTIVLIGASTSRVFASGDLDAGVEGHWMFTPRGYAGKIDGDLA